MQKRAILLAFSSAKCQPSILKPFLLQIPRYIITLHELLAHTPPDHVEKKSLEHARIQLEDLSRQMHDEASFFKKDGRADY